LLFLSKLPHLKEVYARGIPINFSKFPLENNSFLSLKFLCLAESNLRDEDLTHISKCKFLEELIISENNISNLKPLLVLRKLKIIDISGNNISRGKIAALVVLPRLREIIIGEEGGIYFERVVRATLNSIKYRRKISLILHIDTLVNIVLLYCNSY
jgi:Leucine-rich repeat (LRR) protein